MLRGTIFSAPDAAEHVKKNAAASADGTTRRIAGPDVIRPLLMFAKAWLPVGSPPDRARKQEVIVPANPRTNLVRYVARAFASRRTSRTEAPAAPPAGRFQLCLSQGTHRAGGITAGPR